MIANCQRIKLFGPRAKEARPFLLEQLRGQTVPSHSLYPETIRATQAPPSITPRLLEAFSSRYFIVNAIGQDLAELIGELAPKDPKQHDLAQRQLQSLLVEAHPTLRTTAAYALSFQVSVLQTRNTQAIQATAKALGEGSSETTWPLPHPVSVRFWLPYKSPDLEQTIKQISQGQTKPFRVYNILPDAVATYLKVLPRNEWNGIVTIEVTEGGKAAAGATAVVRCGAIQPYRVKDPGQSEPEHRLKPEVTASP